MNTGQYNTRTVAQNTLYLMSKNIVVYLLRLVYVAMCARLLGPELYGLLVYGQTWYMLFLPFALMGMQPAISRLVGLGRYSAPDITRQTLSLRLVSTLLAVTACIGIAWYVSTSQETSTIIYAFSFALAGRAIAQWTNEIFNAFESSQYTFRQESIFRLVEILAGLYFLLSGKGIIFLALLHGAVWWLQAASGMYIVHMKYTPISLNFSISNLKPIFLFAIPFLVGGLLFNWVLQGPIILFRHIQVNKSVAGEFILLMQIFIILSSIYLSVTIAALPVLSRSVARADGKDLVFVNTLLRSTFIICAFAGITGSAFGPIIIPAFFGEQYLSAALHLGTILWCMLPFTTAGIITSCAIARGHYYTAPSCHAAGAMVMTLTMPVLASRWNIVGGIAGTGFGLLTGALLLVAIGIRNGWLDSRRTIMAPSFSAAFAWGVYTITDPVSAWVAYPAGIVALSGIALLTGAVSHSDLLLLLNGIRKSRDLPQRS